ncbi:hypothetical protein F4780DRAFT_686423 [Xylariomycetidae sp. FL0641]|nr:hypothetical protein F4780DRAFT_686423 [Xylariomycetidae sp. FL0641]
MSELKACHNCRRRRLRCDRSVPTCHKCSRSGQECLGYGQLYRWTNTQGPKGAETQRQGGILSRPSRSSRDIVRLTKEKEAIDVMEQQGHGPTFLIDPLLQDLQPTSRHYLAYFASRFCQDLVVHDSMHLGSNPFRELIPMSQANPYLQDIIVAVSALHYCHAMRHASALTPGCRSVANSTFIDALRARQRAIRGVIDALKAQESGSKRTEVTHIALLATILFFVNFSLIDSGKDGWRSHLKAAGRLLIGQDAERHKTKFKSSNYQLESCKEESTPKTELGLFPTDVASLRSLLPAVAVPIGTPLSACDYVASDTVAYYIWNSALDSLAGSSQEGLLDWDSAETCGGGLDTANALRILLRTEANSYHSCPAQLLHLVLRTSRLVRRPHRSADHNLTPQQLQSCLSLLREAQGFDVDAWAAQVCARNLGAHADATAGLELILRRHIARTYRASVCLYILLVAPGLQRGASRVDDDDEESIPTTAQLADTILDQLSFIPTSSPLFKFTTWPVFLTGVETAAPEPRAWVLGRLRAMREICPWGMLTSAMETLQEIWRMRDGEGGTMTVAQGGGMVEGEARRDDRDEWLARLQQLRIDCLIV